MKRIINVLLSCVAIFCCFTANAQKGTTVSGSVKIFKTTEAISAVSVTIKGGTAGAFTNEKGNFKFTTTQKPPFTLVFSSVGYGSKEVNFTGSDVNVELMTSETLGQDVVISATRTQERILESPVSIERMGANALRNSAAPNYYDALANFKGVDMITSSMNFRTVSTRGFNGSGNLRFNQLVDGMDNQAPGLNFAVGSIVGPNQLDVDNVELLQGASSALYGSGGMTGTLLMTSKNPFKYQGLSFQIKAGANHVDEKQNKVSPFHNWDVRWAKKINEKVAFKIGAELTTGQDWQATDYSNLQRTNVLSTPKDGTRLTDPNYDGVNVFGDEASASMQAFAQVAIFGPANTSLATVGAVLAASLGRPPTPLDFINYYATNPTPLQPFAVGLKNNLFGAQYVSRTGYEEKYLVNYNNYNVKLNGAIHYKVTNDIEASLSANYGTGTTVYTGSDRYSIKNLKIGQYKFELKAKNWFLKAYTTQENSGDAYTATTAAVAINSAWKDNTTWFGQYTGNYAGARIAGLSDTKAHDFARAKAETGRYLPGSADFTNALNNAISTPISKGGAKFEDKTNLYHFEGQYNFANTIKVVDILVGASYRKYSLNSNGTIFADTAGSIGVNEVGAYIQFQKKFMDDKLKITASGRYDKQSNFDGRFTPRVTVTYKVAENNYVRASYQQAYRFPTMQDQWINLKTPSAILIGCLPNFNTFYNFAANPAYTAESVELFRKSINTGTPNPTLLIAAPLNTVKPEVSNSFELGYRGVITSKLLIDAYVYYSQFQNFIGRAAVARGKSGISSLASPFTTDNYSFVTNSTNQVNAIGWGVSAEYKAYKNYVVNANISGDQLNNVEPTLFTQYNTPKMRCNIGVSNSNVYKNWGFGANYKWQDMVAWQGTFGSGEIPSYGTVDGFISYKFAPIKSLFKIGATNLYNKYYRSAFGNPQIGGMYYVSFGYNIF